MNEQHRASKAAQKECMELYLLLLLHSRPHAESALLVGIQVCFFPLASWSHMKSAVLVRMLVCMFLLSWPHTKCAVLVGMLCIFGLYFFSFLATCGECTARGHPDECIIVTCEFIAVLVGAAPGVVTFSFHMWRVHYLWGFR